jgi:secreted trypsin-like serine protease
VKYHPFLADPASLPLYEGPVEPSWEQNKYLYLIGAGTIGTSQTLISDWLRQIRADVLSKQRCDMRVDAAYGVPYSTSNLKKENYFCVIDESTLSGACGGDSGSGAVEYINERKRVVCVVAAGPVICSSPNHVNIYGSVSTWLPWIKAAVGNTHTLKI